MFPRKYTSLGFAITTNGHHSTCVELHGLGTCASDEKSCTDLRASLFSTEVNSSHRKPTPGSTKIARKPNLYLFASSFVGHALRGGPGDFL